jgi:hypothetical protein
MPESRKKEGDSDMKFESVHRSIATAISGEGKGAKSTWPWHVVGVSVKQERRAPHTLPGVASTDERNAEHERDDKCCVIAAVLLPQRFSVHRLHPTVLARL